MIEAELPDGTIMEFPDGTAPEIVQQTVKRHLGVVGDFERDADYGAAANRGLASAFGAPIDIASMGINALGNLAGIDQVVDPSKAFGGSESIVRGMQNLGLDVMSSNQKPVDILERGARILGETAGGALTGGALLKPLAAAGGAVGQYADDAMRFITQKPAMAAAGELGGVLGGTLGEEIGAQYDSPTAELIGRVLGGAAGATGGVLGMGAKAARSGKDAFTRQGTQSKAKAAERVQSIVPSVEEGLQSLKKETISDLSPAQRIGTKEALALEKAVMQQSPDMRIAYEQSLAANAKRLRNELVGSGGNVNAPRDALTMRRDALLDAIDNRVEMAAKMAEAKLAKATPQMRETQASRIVASELDKAYSDARAVESALWQKVPDVDVGTGNVRNVYQSIVEKIPLAQRKHIPEEAAQLLGRPQSGVSGDAKLDVLDRIRGLQDELDDLTFNAVRANLSTALERTGLSEGELRAAILQANQKIRKPESLLSFVKRKGGIKEYRGELFNLGITNRTRPGLINNTSGQGMDRMAESAWEAGYFGNPSYTERPTVAQFLDALDQDYRFGNLFEENEGAVYNALREEAGKAAGFLEKHGISSLDVNKELKKNKAAERMADKLRKQISELESELQSASAARPTASMQRRAFGERERLAELQGFRSEMLEEARNAKAAGLNYRAKIASDLANAALEDMGATPDNVRGAAGQAIREALDYSRKVATTFETGQVGRLLGSDRQGVDRVADSLTLRNAVGSGGVRGDVGLDAILKAADTPEMRGAAEQFLLGNFERVAVKNGAVDANAAMRFLQQNVDILDDFPDVKQSIESAVGAARSLAAQQGRAKNLQRSLTQPSKSATAKFLSAVPEYEIGRIYGNPEMAKQVAALVRKDPAAAKGLQAGVLEELLNRSTVREIDASGARVVSGTRMLDDLLDTRTRNSIETVIGKDGVRRAEKIAMELKVLEDAMKAAPAKEITSAPKQTILGRLGGFAGLKAAPLFSPGGPGSLKFASMASEMGRQAAEKLNPDKSAAIVSAAIQDEDLFAALLTNVANPMKASKAYTKIHAWLLANMPEALEQAGGEE